MIGVKQTIYDGITGNCMAACVASILELSIDEVPNYHGEGWWDRWQAWGVNRGIVFRCYWTSEMNWCPAGYCILAPESPTGALSPDGSPMLHAVVVKGGEIVWDPHPEAGARGEMNPATAEDCVLVERI